MRLTPIALGVIAFATTGGLHATACDHQDENGQDVALVLSGGGALATTQIGALQVVEELGVPIHCVVGTSMGSVVGGLYASGYDADEIAEIFETSDWGTIFRGEIGRRDKPYLQKEVEDRYFSGYAASITDEGVTLPGGLRDMRGLRAHFRDLVGHLSIDEDFNALRVPYRAVATDLSTGEAVAIAEGDIVQAMLASMAVPGVFASRQYQGRALVDGGLSSQLSIRTAIEMGADIIIAIDTTVPPPQIEGTPSIAETTQQLIRLSVWKSWQEDTALLDDDDVLIQPELEGLSTSSFHLAREGFASGRTAAEGFRAQLLRIKDQAAATRDRSLDPSTRKPASDELVIANRTEVKNDIIEQRFDYRSEDLDDPEKVDRKLKDLASFGAFGEVDLSLANGKAILEIDPPSLEGTLVQVGLRASSTFDGDASYGLLGRLSRRPFGPGGGEASLAFQLGSDVGVSAELYQPFGARGRLFVIPSVSYRGEEILFDVGDFRFAELWQQTGTARVRLGWELGQWGVIAIDGLATIGNLDPVVSIDPATFQNFDYGLGGAGLLFGVDTLDRADWASSGLQFRAYGQTLFDFEDGAETEKYSLRLMKPFVVGGIGVVIRAQAESVQNDENDPVEILRLGGFRRLSAFSENSIPNNEHVLASLEFFRRITATDRIVTFPIYVGATAEYANVDFDIFEQGLTQNLAAGSLYIGADTIFGPAFFGAGFAEEGQYSIFLHFGRSF
jgi:NTE family protein